jgi:hypothetical protein
MEMTTTTSAEWPCDGTDKGGGRRLAGVGDGAADVWSREEPWRLSV